MVSRGEYLTAKLLAEYVGYTFIDAKELIFFDYTGEIDEERTKQAIITIYQEKGPLVVPGFYGANPVGKEN